jgi:hypothetical protein
MFGVLSMRWQVYLMVFIILLGLCGIAVAQSIPDESKTTISPSEPDWPWVVANGSDSTPISVTVKDSSGNPLPNIVVTFSVNNSNLGTLSPTTSSTNANGVVSTTFRSKTVSGTAEVIATIHYTEEGINKIFNESVTIYIDHDTPYTYKFLSYPNETTVGSTGSIQVRLQDSHGNIIENRNYNYTETVNFSIITIGDTSRFWNASNDKDCSVPVDSNGTAQVNISFGTESGDTLIRVVPPSPIPEKTIKITRTADGIPYYMYVERDPSVSYVPADGSSKFVFTFSLYDQYWNILNNKQIKLVAESGPTWTVITTTFYGKAGTQYGPFINDTTKKGEIFTTNLIATAVDNSSVKAIIPVEFYDPSPVSLFLTINPKNLPSRDANDTSKAVATAVVVDQHGKGVGGEVVDLSIPVSEIDNGIFKVNNSTLYPCFGTASVRDIQVTTNPSGFAYVDFLPGEFDYNELRDATGQCEIVAIWKNEPPKTVTPIWKNYGYLSVTTWLEDNTTVKDQEVNVSVIVQADGPGFAAKPIDMIFCVDRGASMLWDTRNIGGSEVVDDKMIYVYKYGSDILQELDEGDDRAGVVSFGPGEYSMNWPKKYPGNDSDAGDDIEYINLHYPGPYTGYDNWATINMRLNETFNPLANDTIQSLRPFGDPWKDSKHNVPLRFGLYTAINDMIGLGESNPRKEAIRAIVLLTDPEWNDWGDPSAGWDGTSVSTQLANTKKAPWDLPEGGLSAWVPFTEFGKMVDGNITSETGVQISDPRQNMANYAKEHDIIIYSIAYPKKDANIDNSRERVLRSLADSTGGMYFEARNGTSLGTIFELIGKDLRQRAVVNTTAVLNFKNVTMSDNKPRPGVDIFDYVYRYPTSTWMRKWTNCTSDGGCDFKEDYQDDTENWTRDQKLTFDLGTMNLGDRWVVNFTLKAKDAFGIGELFNESYISSDNNPDIVIPPSIIIGNPTTRGDIPTEDLTVTLFVDDSMNNNYSIHYTGNKTVHAKLYYTKVGEITEKWTQFASNNLQGNFGTLTGEASVNKWLLGTGNYTFKIEAWASDTPMDTAYAGPVGIEKKFFILLR